MSRRNRPFGKCCVCGREDMLTFEHVPPQRAFNDRRSVIIKMDEWLELGPNALPKGPISQGGIGNYTLCGACNNNIGSWYGSSFVDWCYQGMDILIRSGGNPSLFYLNYLFPLRIIKQIISMFACVNGAGFCERNPEVRSFLLNRTKKYLPENIKVFVYYNTSSRFRYIGMSGILKPFEGTSTIISEISYPPFGYVMTFDGSIPDNRLLEITPFATFDYDKFTVGEISMKVLETLTPHPADYRSKKQILEEASAPSIPEGQMILTNDKYGNISEIKKP